MQALAARGMVYAGQAPSLVWSMLGKYPALPLPYTLCPCAL